MHLEVLHLFNFLSNFSLQGHYSFFYVFSSSTQTHILELIKELGLETYPQYNVGKKVYHTGGPGARIYTYTSRIPVLSPLVLMDFIQMLWRVRQQSRTKHSMIRTSTKLNMMKQASFQCRIDVGL